MRYRFSAGGRRVRYVPHYDAERRPTTYRLEQELSLVPGVGPWVTVRHEPTVPPEEWEAVHEKLKEQDAMTEDP